MKKLTTAKIRRIERLARSGMSLREIARRTGQNPKTVAKYVERAGIAIGPAHGRGGRACGRTEWTQKNLTADERRQIRALVMEGVTVAETARRIGRSEGAVRRVVRGEHLRLVDPATRARRHPLDEGAFHEASPERDYWAGFIAADGNVSGTRITVVQTASEAGHLKRYLAYVGSPTRPLYEQPLTNSVSAVVWSRVMVDDLAGLGISERKSDTLSLERELAASPAAWLGLLDGDGTVMSPSARSGPRLTWVGAPSAMEQCAAFWSGVLGRSVPHYMFNRSASPLWAVTLSHYSAQHAAEVLLASVPYSLPRKRLTLVEVAAYRSARVIARLAWEGGDAE